MALRTTLGAPHRLATSTSLALVLVACGASPVGDPGNGLEDTGSATAAINLAPTNVQCVTIKVVGKRTVDFSFNVAPQTSTVFDLQGLPFGKDSFSAKAYAQPCATVISTTPPSYLSDTVTATVDANVSPTIALQMAPPQPDAGTATVGLDFPMMTPPKVTEFPLTPISNPATIVTGPDGNLWFTEAGRNAVGRMAPDGTLTEFELSGAVVIPLGIAAGSDGNLWVTSINPVISRVTPSGVVTTFTVPTPNGGAYGITAGPDGALWFTESGADRIGRITVAGSITEFPVAPNSHPHNITTGSDGNLWFTMASAAKIGRLTLGGALTEFPIPSGSVAYDIAAGPDGNLWFTQPEAQKIARLGTNGTITEFAAGGPPYGICAGPDGNVWFGMASPDFIARVTPTGGVTAFAIPTPDAGILSCTSGPDGKVWFVENLENRIGNITP